MDKSAAPLEPAFILLLLVLGLCWLFPRAIAATFLLLSILLFKLTHYARQISFTADSA